MDHKRKAAPETSKEITNDDTNAINISGSVHSKTKGFVSSIVHCDVGENDDIRASDNSKMNNNADPSLSVDACSSMNANPNGSPNVSASHIEIANESSNLQTPLATAIRVVQLALWLHKEKNQEKSEVIHNTNTQYKNNNILEFYTSYAQSFQ